MNNKKQPFTLICNNCESHNVDIVAAEDENGEIYCDIYCKDCENKITLGEYEYYSEIN